MSDLPPPLTPPDCDLRGLPYLPLDMARLFDSEFYALSTGDEFKAGVSLWCKSITQLPAGSLPADDRMLAYLSGAGANWCNVKEMALHGWIKCSDGRLYHRTVAEKVVDAWNARIASRARTEAARAARHPGKHTNGSQPPPSVTEDVTENVTEVVTESVTGSKLKLSKGKEREAKQRKKDSPLATLAPSAGAEDARDFEAFWSAYPRKVGRGTAIKAFAAACRKAPAETIIAAVQQAIWSPNPRFIPHPTTWLHGERWTDEVEHPDAALLRAVGLSPGGLLQ